MEADQLKFILQELSFSAVLPPEVLDRLAEESTLTQLSAGESIFREGTVNHNLFLIRRGRIALEMTVPGRGAVRILTLGEGEMVGWSALLGAGRMTTCALAVEATEVIVAPAVQLQSLSEADHDFGFHVMRRMADALSKRLVATRLQLLDLFADDSSTSPNG